MPTNFNIPGGGTINAGGYIGINPTSATFGVFPSVLQSGGYQEMPAIADRNEIPVEYASTAGFGTPKITDDGWGSGRRRVGMMVHVLDAGSGTPKLYQLIPNGYFGNNGTNGITEWQALSDNDKFALIDPTASFNAGFTPPNNYTEGTGSGNANDCWVELQLGGDNIYTSNLAGTIAMVDDVGGMPSGTLVSDLTNVKTYDELFDTILFPTSYPTASQPSVSLTDTFSLKEIGEVINVPLTTTANLGQITLDSANQGPYAGSVTSASISGPGGPYTLNVGPGATDIDNLTVPSHTVVEGTAGNQWTLTATFAQGPMPLDSTGADYPSLQFAGGNKTNSTNFEGVYPIFLGNASNGFDQRALISHGANNIQCNQQYDEDLATGLYHRISIPNDMIDGRTIQVFQLNTVSGNYDEATSGWVQTADADRTIQGNQVAYTLLTSSVAITGGNDYRIKFI